MSTATPPSPPASPLTALLADDRGRRLRAALAERGRREPGRDRGRAGSASRRPQRGGGADQHAPVCRRATRCRRPRTDEFYLADLIGLARGRRRRSPLGEVAVVHDYGAGASLEIARPQAPPLILPFTARRRCRWWMCAGRPHRGRSAGDDDGEVPRRNAARCRHELARHRPDAVPRDVSGAARALRSPAARLRRALVAATCGYPRAGLGRHRTVDDTPFGGGAGMVMRPDVVATALAARRQADDARPLVYLTPRGRRFTQAVRGASRPGRGVRPALRPLRGHRPARDRGARARRNQHRRLRAVRRRTRRRWCCWTPACGCCPASWAPPRAPSEESFARGPAGISALHPPRRMAGPRRAATCCSPAIMPPSRAWRRAESERATRERRPDLWERYRQGRMARRTRLRRICCNGLARP